MPATMSFVNSYTGFGKRADKLRAASSAKARSRVEVKSRPHQSAIEVNDLPQQERDDLADLLEAELARL
jgi:hypothetical protein